LGLRVEDIKLFSLIFIDMQMSCNNNNINIKKYKRNRKYTRSL